MPWPTAACVPFQVEYLGIVAFGAVATLALARGSALLPALGYLGHGLWDLPLVVLSHGQPMAMPGLTDE